MCRNITELRGLQPPATEDEIEAAAAQGLPSGRAMRISKQASKRPTQCVRTWSSAPGSE